MWGHGRNFQADSTTIAQRWKQFWATRCDWWFAYTEETKSIVEGYGFPSQRITAIENAIDTAELRSYAKTITGEELLRAKQKFGIESDNIGIYVGGIYEHKRIDFLLAAAAEIRKRVPDFVLVMVGGGAESHIVATASARHSWIRYLGPRLWPRESRTHVASSGVLDAGAGRPGCTRLRRTGTSDRDDRLPLSQPGNCISVPARAASS